MQRRKFLASITAGLTCSGFAQAAAPRPNIVFILTDDLGLADLGCYGAKDIRTPAIDRLAAQGVRFTQFYSNGPLCSPTRAGLMTGRYQQRVGIEYAWTPRDAGKGLLATEPTLPKLLRAQGYKTALVGKWHLGGDDKFLPTQHGFDEFFGFLGSDHDYYSHQRTDGTPDLWEGTTPVTREGYSTDLFGNRAMQFLQQNHTSPFFLYLSLNAPHWPFQAPGNPSDVRTRDTWYAGTRKDYAQMVERVDDVVGQVLETLQRQKLADNTLLIFSNDNGGERLSNNAPAFHHKMTLWEGGIRVPTILRWPSQFQAQKIKPGTTSAQVAITMDLTATMLAAAGATTPPSHPLEGIDLMPFLSGKTPAAQRTFFWRYIHPPISQKAVRQGPWKYLLDGRQELLFHLATDPSERNDVAFQHPAKVAQLRALLETWEKAVQNPPPPFEIK